MIAERKYDGLSPSSLALFTSCQRKYWLKKIAKVKIDPDSAEDTEALRVGSAFHKCLEVTKHNLDGFTLGNVRDICAEFDLSDDLHVPMIYVMLGKYKEVHKKSGLKVLACEVCIDTPLFYGFVDAVMENGKGEIFICDMKTSASFSPALIPTLPRHPQLNLYYAYRKEIADQLGLDVEQFKGFRYRLTTKSKMMPKKGDTTLDFIGRLGGSVRSFDFAVPAYMIDPGAVDRVHKAAWDYITAHKEEPEYAPNYGSCQQYFRPCEYWSKCHGKCFSDMGQLATIESD